MATARRPAIPQEKVELCDKLIASTPGVQRKGVTVPYTSLNGHMFSYLDGSGSMALKLSPEDRADFLKRFKTSLFKAYGIVQKEFVTVPAESDHAEILTEWLLGIIKGGIQHGR